MEVKELVRQYSGADSFMTQSARTVHTLMHDEMGDFTAFDSTMNAAFDTDFLNKVEAAEAVVSDNVVIDQVALMTEQVETAMTGARNKYVETRFFVLKAFPNSKAIQNQFGLNDYEMARRTAPRMIDFLRDMFSVATEHQSALIAVGYSALKIAEIDNIREALLYANAAQELAMKQRPKTTEERITILNTCYEKMRLVNAAAQIVYMNDYAKKAQFVYDPTAGSYDGPGDYEGIVAAGASVEVAHVIYNAGRTLIFENTGTTTLQFWLNGGGLSTQGTVMDIIATQNSGTLTMADLDNSGNHIIVKNTSNSVAGSYKVTVGSI